MFSGKNLLKNFVDNNQFQYSCNEETPKIKVEKEENQENNPTEVGYNSSRGYESNTFIKTEINPPSIIPQNVESAADKLKNFFEHEGIRLPRGTEILIAPVKSNNIAYDEANHQDHQFINQPNKMHFPEIPQVPDSTGFENDTYEKLTKNYCCSICDKSFSTELFLATHLRFHSVESINESYINEHNVSKMENTTISSVENSNTFSCPVCQKCFNMKRYLSNHLRSHNMKLVDTNPNFDGESYTCRQCQKSYTKKASFIAHMKAHDDRPFKCDICSRLFKEIGSLNVHKSLHSATSKHQCNVCGLYFKFRSQLKIHEWTHSDNKFTCKFCGKIFRNYFSCRSHENNHVNGKRFICCFCEKSFKYKVALKAHLITHSRPYKCDSCNRTFDNETKLESHKKNHLFEKFQMSISEGGVETELNDSNSVSNCDVKQESVERVDSDEADMRIDVETSFSPDANVVEFEKPVKIETVVDNSIVDNIQLHFLENVGNQGSSSESAKESSAAKFNQYDDSEKAEFKIIDEVVVDHSCKHCGQPFKRLKKLEKHLRKHNEYKCERCIKSFETEADLLQHTLHHTEESFKCNYCDSMFTNKYTLQYHIKRHLKRYRCNYCPKSFDNETQLEDHKNTHQSVYKCEFCDKDFKFHSLLTNHLKIHTRPFKCDMCDRSFDQNELLTRHQKSAHSSAANNFMCHICDRSFNYESTLNTHLRSHNRQYQCVYCMRSFNDESRYQKHVKKHEHQFIEHKCDKCQKVFKYHSQLLLHVKNHRNAYKCDECQLQFKHWKSYEKHKRVGHTNGGQPEDKGLKCEKCDKKFLYPSQLLLHIKNHENAHRCEDCQLEFSHWKSYDKHIRMVHEENQNSEEFSCNQCNMKFKYQSQLKYHAEAHNRRYSCHCGKTFNSYKYFVSHKNSHTLDNLKCDFCDREFKYYSTLKMHLKAHLKSATFQCFHCEQVFKTKYKVQKHIENRHMKPKPIFKCTVCEKSYKYLSQLKTHATLHERLYKCKVCEKSFNSKRYYKCHKRKHLNTNLTCQQCGKVFKYYSLFHFHLKTQCSGQNGLRKKCLWNCNLCGKRFKFRCVLKTHMKIHEGVKPFQCNYCLKRFAWKSSLQMHLSFVHKHKTRFHCETCDRYFFYESQYKQHMTSCSWDVSFNCQYCSKQLKSRKTYDLHVLKHEGTKQFICAYCGKDFFTKQVLLNHIKKHLENEIKACPICGEQFMSKFRYNSHVENHSVEFRCSVCDKVFKCKYKLKRHVMTVHQRHQTFSCLRCGKLFLRESALNNHQITHHGQGEKEGQFVEEEYMNKLPEENEEEIDVKPDISELGILVPEVIYENHV